MSVDPAHSLGDSFNIGGDLFHKTTSDPLKIVDGLEIQEVNIQREIKRHWQEISKYVVTLLKTTGISGVEAEEFAISAITRLVVDRSALRQGNLGSSRCRLSLFSRVADIS